MIGWIIPSATLVLLPKCPICLAGYVALFSGVGISVASASVLVVSVSALVFLTVKYLRRLKPPVI
jgi:hypothetical protein